MMVWINEKIAHIWELIHRKYHCLRGSEEGAPCAWCDRPSTFDSPGLLCDHHWATWWARGMTSSFGGDEFDANYYEALGVIDEQLNEK